jgi:hypothetical protein
VTQAMVLSAEKLAPHTTNGAVEVATAFVRWLNQYPYPSASTYAAIEKRRIGEVGTDAGLDCLLCEQPEPLRRA